MAVDGFPVGLGDVVKAKCRRVWSSVRAPRMSDHRVSGSLLPVPPMAVPSDALINHANHQMRVSVIWPSLPRGRGKRSTCAHCSILPSIAYLMVTRNEVPVPMLGQVAMTEESVSVTCDVP